MQLALIEHLLTGMKFCFFISLFFLPAQVLAENSVLVEAGQSKEIQYIGKEWIHKKGFLTGRSDRSRMISLKEIDTDQFHLKATLTIPKLSHQNPEVGLGPFSYIQLDGNGGRFLLGGPLFTPDDQMIRYSIVGRNNKLIKAGKPFLFEVTGKSGFVEFRIDGKMFHQHQLLRKKIGPVSLFPGSGEIQVSGFSVQAKKLKPYQPGNINSYGVLLDQRLKWRPELRKTHYVKLNDGSLAYLNGHQLMISTDEGKTWEARPSKVLSDQFGSELSFSGGLLLRTKENTFVAVMINSKNSVHLDWDEKTKSAIAGRREVWTMRSLDEGRTWIDVQKIYGGYCGALVDMIQSSQGNIIIPVQEFLFDRKTHITRAYVSEDEGQTWKKGNTLDIGGFGNHAGSFEPTLAELADGRLMMLMRTNLDYLWAAYSDSKGQFWRETRPSHFEASSSPAFLTRLESGRLMLVWNRVYPEGKSTYRRRIGKWSETPVSWCREEMSMAMTDLSGKNWSDPIVVAKKPGIWMAYPYLFEPEPGKIWLFASGGLTVEFLEKDFLKK